MNPDEKTLLSQLMDCYNKNNQGLLVKAAIYASPFHAREDILQDALMAAVRRVHDFPKKKCSWLTWLMGLIRTAGLDSRRKQYRKQSRVVLASDLGTLGDGESEELAEVTAGDWTPPDEWVSHMEDVHLIRKAMAQLLLEKPKWHAVISAIYSGDKDYSHLAVTAAYRRKIHQLAIERLNVIANELRNR